MVELVLYGHEDSGHACKVALALSLANLEYQTVWVDIWSDSTTRPADFLKGSPFAEVPLLMIDGVAHVQSGAILLEIAERFKCLGGESEAGLRRARELILWEANRIGMCLPQLQEARRVKGQGFAAEAVAWLKMRYDVDCIRFAKLLQNMPFFHGERPGIGDCAIFGYTQWLQKAGVEATPVMQVWLERMLNLPAMKSPSVFFPTGGSDRAEFR